MAKSRRVVTYLSEEQHEVFKAEMERRGVDEAEMLRIALEYYWGYHGIPAWPENNPKRGGKRDGAGRKIQIDT